MKIWKTAREPKPGCYGKLSIEIMTTRRQCYGCYWSYSCRDLAAKSADLAIIAPEATPSVDEKGSNRNENRRSAEQ